MQFHENFFILFHEFFAQTFQKQVYNMILALQTTMVTVTPIRAIKIRASKVPQVYIIQAFSVQAPQHPKKATIIMMAPRTIKTMAELIQALSETRTKNIFSLELIIYMGGRNLPNLSSQRAENIKNVQAKKTCQIK